MNDVSTIHTGTVDVPHDYFRKAVREYADWILAYWREILQNAIDAGAFVINIQVQDLEEHVYIEVEDNGCGMSLETLQNALLCLGGSYKDNPAAIGQFGYAKNLLFFAHDSYQIATRNMIVIGEGGQYKINNNTTEVINGTIIKVWIPKARFKADAATLELYLKSYVAHISVDPRPVFTLNDVVLPSRSTHEEFIRQTDLGAFSFSEHTGSGTSMIVVTIRGLPMFVYNQYTYMVHFRGVLELNSNEHLLTNRDGFQDVSQNKFYALMRQLTANRTALKVAKNVTVFLNAPDGQGASLERTTTTHRFMNVRASDFVQSDDWCYGAILIEDLIGGKVRGTKDGFAKILAHCRKERVLDAYEMWSTLVLQIAGNAEVLSSVVTRPAGELRINGKLLVPSMVISDGAEAACRHLEHHVLVGFNPMRINREKNDATRIYMLWDGACHELAHLLVPDHCEAYEAVAYELRKDSFHMFLALTEDC